ncbi:MAG: Hsp70 family protein, partial [Cyanobacteria bacterium J06631_6]
ILVFDLGGGTFDVSILQLGNGVFEVKATAGNNHLGGDDFDNAIVRWMIKTFYAQEEIDLRTDKMALQRMREASEKAKIELSAAPTTSINLPFITADETGPKHIELELSRAKFEELSKDLIQKTLEPVKLALKDSDLEPSEIDRIILVGGSTRIPAVQTAIKTIFDSMQIDRSVNPDEAVAAGAAIQAGVLGGEVEDVLLLDITPLSLGIETLGEVFTKIIEKNTTVPTSKSQIFSTAADGQTSVEIHALQGERAMAKDNKSLGKFLLTGIPVAPRGMPQIEVSFEIDVNGILQVSAQDKGTGKQQSITISNTGGLSSSEVDRMRQEANDYADRDRRQIELVKLKNQAENLIYNYDSTVSEQGELIRDEYKARIARIKEEFNIACNNPHTSMKEITAILDSLRQTLLEIGTDVYQQKNSDTNDSFVFDDFDDRDLAEARTEVDLDGDNSIKAVVNISHSSNIEGGVDLGLDDPDEDYESVD